jgi:O-acetyl-ADP-ribose deacetylase (regulator of RNase III)
MIRVVEGDLFETNTKVICHQVNCQGVMGSGVALLVKQKYPHVFEEYQMFCKENKSLLGKVLPVKCNDGKIICNLFAQDRFGYDGKCYTSYEALEECFNSLKNIVSKKDEISMPYLMGCHRGGGDWDIVFKMISDCFETHNVILYKKNGGK